MFKYPPPLPLLLLCFNINTYSIDLLTITAEDLTLFLKHSLISKFYLHCKKEFSTGESGTYHEITDLDPRSFFAGDYETLKFVSYTPNPEEEAIKDKNENVLIPSSDVCFQHLSEYWDQSQEGEYTPGNDLGAIIFINSTIIREKFSSIDPIIPSLKEGKYLEQADFFRNSLIENIMKSEAEIYIDSDEDPLASFFIKEKINIKSATFEDIEDYKYKPPDRDIGFPGGSYYLQAKEDYTKNVNSHFPPYG